MAEMKLQTTPINVHIYPKLLLIIAFIEQYTNEFNFMLISEQIYLKSIMFGWPFVTYVLYHDMFVAFRVKTATHSFYLL